MTQFWDLTAARLELALSPSGRSSLRGHLPLGLILILVSGVLTLSAAQVRVPNGTMVRVRLHYDLTTENAEKGDRVEFDVAENVVVNNHVVIPKGAVAWGQVIKVKGAGNRKAKDASVSFRLMAVRAADNQEIPVRMIRYKSKKSDPKDNEIEANSPIPGLRERIIGAEKGTEYAAYTDADAIVNAQEVQATQPSPPASSPGATSPGGTGSAAPTTPAPPQPSVPLLGVPDQASIDFNSNPSGADILIDGSFVGNTPSTLRVSPGRHAIEVRQAGYRAWTRNMVVDPGSHPSIRANLEKE